MELINLLTIILLILVFVTLILGGVFAIMVTIVVGLLKR